MQESRIDDNWNIDGSRDLSDSWTGFTQFTLLEEKPPDGYMWSGWDWQNGKRHPGQIIYGQNSGENWERMPSWRRGKSGQMKNLTSIMHENYEEFISLTLRTRNSRRPSRVLPRNWKHQWLPLCLAKQARTVKIGWLVVNPMRSSLNLRVSWKPVNLQDCVWKNLYRKYHQDHIAGKGDNSLQHYHLVHKFIPMHEAMKIPAANAAVDKEWEKLEKISAWNLTKVRSKKEVIDEARTKGAGVHFASLMDIRHLKNAELETKHQKYKGRVVLRGDIVKDDSGSYAVFTEQGSSASQMTAAKVMDIISRLPGCAGQAADAVSAYTQVKMEDAPKLLKFPKSECPDICIRLPRHKWAKSWSSMEDPVVPLERIFLWSSFGRTNMWKAIWENPIEVRLGEGFQLGMLIRTPWKRIVLICVCGRHQIGWKETKHWSDVESTQ